MGKRLVISLGGSLLNKLENFGKYATLLRRQIYGLGHKVLVVCGGGELARNYQDLLPEGTNPVLRDKIGIIATQLNALTLSSMLEESGVAEILSYSDAAKFYDTKILCYGGEKPGHSTDWDAVWFAKQLNADLIINATNVDGIFDKNPHQFLDAKLIPELTYEDYLQQFSKNWEPGLHEPFDSEAVKLMLQGKPRIPTVVVNGQDINNILKATRAEKVGTLLK